MPRDAATSLDAAADGARTDAASPTTRDFVAHPAVHDQASFTTLYALSDVHGGQARLLTLLQANGVIDASAAWTAGDATLMVAGDLFDKGPQGIEVMDFLAALAPRATAAGGTVVVLLGNHEAEFLADPRNSKATGSDGIDVELAADGIDPAAVASGMEAHGAWLRERPLAARVGGWFFAHAANSKGRTVAALEAVLEAALGRGYDDPELIADDSLLESRDWYSPSGAAQGAATALGVRHIVFGHTPGALGPNGSIATAQAGLLMRIDCGMSPLVNDSTGCLLRVTHAGPNDVAVELDASGHTRALWTGPSQ